MLHEGTQASCENQHVSSERALAVGLELLHQRAHGLALRQLVEHALDDLRAGKQDALVFGGLDGF